jgi:hypothetical protein
MDRFSETVTFQLSKTQKYCPECKQACSELVYVPGFDFEACESCAEQAALLISREDEQGEPLCPVEYELVLAASSVLRMRIAIELHQKSTCIFCLSRKDVARESRIVVGPTEKRA